MAATNLTEEGGTNVNNSIDAQLAQASAAQRARQAEMRRYTTFKRAWNGVKNTAGKDHNTIRLSAIVLVILISIFSSLILIIALADLPHTTESLYAHSDMIKFMNDLREKALRETPPEHPARWSKDSNVTWFSGIEREIRFLLEQWWPISHSQYDSADVILNERNFFLANFNIFRHSFTVFNVIANILLFSIWIIFITAKEVRRIKLAKPHEVQNSWKSDKTQDSVEDREKKKSKKENFIVRKVKKLYGSTIRYLARIFWWIPPIKNEWFSYSHPSGPLWERTSFFVTFMLCLFHILIEALLLKRPTFFALLFQQISFLILSVICLASTYIELVSSDEEAQENGLFFPRNEPKSLRGSFRGEDKPSGTRVWTTPESTKLFARTSRIAPLPIETVIEEDENHEIVEEKRKKSISRSVSQDKGIVGGDDEYPDESNPFADEEIEKIHENVEEEEKRNKKMQESFSQEKENESSLNDPENAGPSSMKRSMIF